jgi:hypothetical protein
MFKLHAICFTTNKKAHDLAIDYANVLQIKNDGSAVRLELKEPFQLGYRRLFDPATQDEHRECPSCRGLNPENHRSGPLANIAFSTCCTALLRSEQRSLIVQPRAQRDLIENTVSKKKAE